MPWINTQDVPSMGRRSRIWGWKCGRFHRLLSDLETAYFFVLEWSPRVKDIREQFSLPREETQNVAERGQLRHPVDPETHEPVVMTTDFVVTLDHPGGAKPIVNKARSTKYARDLGSVSTVEKLEIERRCWEERDVDWGLVTAREIPPAVIQNVRWLYPYLDPQAAGHPALSGELLRRVDEVLRPRIQGGNESLSALAGWCDDRLSLRVGTSLAAARHFLSNRQWRVDMLKLIEPSKPLELLDALDPKILTENDADEDKRLDRVA